MFSTKTFYAVALLAALTEAQLPQECFLHSDVFDSVKKGNYESDLPLLELRYDPEFDLDHIAGLLDDKGELVGVQMVHKSFNFEETLTLRSIGGEGTQRNNLNLAIKANPPIEEFAVVYDPDFGHVCNVIIGFDNTKVEVSKDARMFELAKRTSDRCKVDWDLLDNTRVIYNMGEEYPIVGFHGRTKDDRLVDVGVIWLDTNNEKCQERLPPEYLDQMLKEGLPTPEQAWMNLSDEQKQQGKELEALMTFHSLTEAKTKQKEILHKLQKAID